MGLAWLLLLFASIVVLLFNQPELSITAMLMGAEGAVSLSLKLAAMYGFWLGFFNVLERLGITDFLAKLLNPVVKLLFRGADDKTRKYISLNISANLLGLGNAATPMGIQAINSMYNGQKKATTNMIMLIVISGTSLQILPTTVIGMRAAGGAANATDFLFPCIVATISSTIIGILLVKLFSKFLPDKESPPLPLKSPTLRKASSPTLSKIPANSKSKSNNLITTNKSI